MPDQVKGAERQSAQMSKITIHGLTRSDIQDALMGYAHMTTVGVKGLILPDCLGSFAISTRFISRTI